jgi:hypothetical protein
MLPVATIVMANQYVRVFLAAEAMAKEEEVTNEWKYKQQHNGNSFDCFSCGLNRRADSDTSNPNVVDRFERQLPQPLDTVDDGRWGEEGEEKEKEGMGRRRFELLTPAMSRRYPNQARPPAQYTMKKFVAQIYVVDCIYVRTN